MQCTKCQSERFVKSGILRGKQRFKCKDCGRHFMLNLSQTVDAEDEKKRLVRQAFMLYMAGFSTHKIAAMLGSVTHVTVMNWLRRYGRGLAQIRSTKTAHLVTLKDSHHIRGSLMKAKGDGFLIIEQSYDTLVSLSSGKREPKDIWSKVYDYEYYTEAMDNE